MYPIVSAPGPPCALTRESRFDIFRRLVRSRPDGLAAGNTARHCKLSAPTCSLHLKELDGGGLLNCCRHDRSQIYPVNFRAVRALLGYLTEHCCSEDACDDGGPQVPPGQVRGVRPEASRPAPANRG